MAGFFDGEGTIDFHKSLRARVSNTYLPVLKALRSTYGGAIYRKTSRGPRSRPAWSWEVTGDNATLFLRRISDLLYEKRVQAKVALAMLYMTPRERVKYRALLSRLKRAAS